MSHETWWLNRRSQNYILSEPCGLQYTSLYNSGRIGFIISLRLPFCYVGSLTPQTYTVSVIEFCTHCNRPRKRSPQNTRQQKLNSRIPWCACLPEIGMICCRNALGQFGVITPQCIRIRSTVIRQIELLSNSAVREILPTPWLVPLRVFLILLTKWQP